MSSSHARALAFTTPQRVFLQTALIVAFAFASGLCAVLPAFAQEAGLLQPLPAEPVIGPAPEVSFSVTPASVTRGSSATLAWDSTFADVCTGTLFDTQNATSGSVSVTPSETTTYSLTCGGMGGNTTAETLLTVTDSTLSASASVVPNSGTAPLTASFTAAATGGTGSYTYTWSFGDGTANSTEQNPTHTYQSAGTYTATLTLTSGTQTDTDSVTVTVTAPVAPTADVSANPTTLTRGAASTISWSSTNATACLGTNFTTNSQTSGSVSVSPTETTTYTLACTGAGGTATDTVAVTVTEPALSASASVVPNSGTAPLTASFTAAATGGTGSYTYSWSFGDGTATSTEQNPSHVYQSAGTYTATLTVTSGTQTDTDSVTVTVTAPSTATNLLTNASFETATNWTSGFFTSSKGTIARVTTDKKSGTYSYMIDGKTDSSSGQIYGTGVNQVAVTPGKEYTFKTWYKGPKAWLSVKWYTSAGAELSTSRVNYQLANTSVWTEGGTKVVAPANAARAWVFLQSRTNTTPVYFDDVWFSTDTGTVQTQTPTADLTASASSVTSGNSVTLSWTSTNSTSCTGTNFSTGGTTSGSVSVTPTVTTTYTLACTGAGGTVSDTVTVTVTTADPALSASASVVPNSGTAPLIASFTAAATGGTGGYTYAWSFGDGTANSSEQNPTHTYQTAGTYTATLTVTSGTQTDSDSVTVTVTAPSTATNLLTNASFETANDWTGGFWSSSKGTIARVTNDKKSGSYSYMIDGLTTSSAGQVYSAGANQVAVTPAKAYTFSTWYKGTNTWLSIKWYNSAGAELSTSRVNYQLANTSTWTQGTVRATAPTGAAKAWVFVQVRNSDVPAYFDDLSFIAQ